MKYLLLLLASFQVNAMTTGLTIGQLSAGESMTTIGFVMAEKISATTSIEFDMSISLGDENLGTEYFDDGYTYGEISYSTSVMTYGVWLKEQFEGFYLRGGISAVNVTYAASGYVGVCSWYYCYEEDFYFSDSDTTTGIGVGIGKEFDNVRVDYTIFGEGVSNLSLGYTF